MAHKPFRTSPTPARNVNQTKPVAAPPGGHAVVRSRETGDPLPQAAQDAPDHNPLIDWPQPALGVDHKPMKTGGK